MKTQVFYSHGKLLLTGEYVVLDNATALAIPTKKGQYLSIKPIKESKIIWKSFDENHQIWFQTEFDLSLKENKNSNKEQQTLWTILQVAKTLNVNFLNTNQGYLITTRLTFNRKFGLGSSSTLIANIAKWANVNPFELLQKSFGGSGYDIACTNSNTPLSYNRNKNTPIITSLNFNPVISKQIYFVYLNKKQDSKTGIQLYKKLNSTNKELSINKINEITQQFISCKSLNEFNKLVENHENIISTLIETPTVKENLFKDYIHGSIKSLGAWGGDFIMVTVKTEDNLTYFKEKEYLTIIPFEDMML